MKILVFDDKQEHRDAAMELLAGHELVVVDTFDKAMDALRVENGYDVVMTDLMVPASARGLNTAAMIEHEGKEMPLGTIVALKALAIGVRKVAVLTDVNHHHHPASAAFSGFCHFERSKDCAVKVLCTDLTGGYNDAVTGEALKYDFLFNSEEGRAKYPGTEWGKSSAYVKYYPKNWLRFLTELCK